jgi:FeS assembly SUF system regulator
MIRLSRLSDYAVVLMSQLGEPSGHPASAQQVSAATGLSLPTVSKLLKLMHRAGLVHSTRGSQGGYVLAVPSAEITVAAIIEAVDGPISLTDCAIPGTACQLDGQCPTQHGWAKLNNTVRSAFVQVHLSDFRSHACIGHAALAPSL